MSAKPAVSIVLIFFNEERFLGEAVASVRAQTFGDWELLLCDDGSTDASPQRAKAFAGDDPRVRYLQHEGHANKGMSETRNLGIRNARGAFLSFLDADDLWLPTKLERQVSLLEAHPEAGFVTAPAQWWFGWTGEREDAQRDYVQRLHVKTDSVVDPPALITSYLKDEFASLCDVMIRREVMERLGGYESQFKGLYEDQAFHAKLCLREKAYVCSDAWYRYRQHPDSCCYKADEDDSRRVIRERFLTWLESYLDEQGAQDPELRAVLKRELLPFRHPTLGRLRDHYRRWRNGVLQGALTLGRVVLPGPARAFAWRAAVERKAPPLRWLALTALRSPEPYTRDCGYDRGNPVDRHYIEAFLEANRSAVRGRVLEIADDEYTRRFGGDQVTQSDVLHSPIGTPKPKVTLIDDLTTGEHMPSDTFDCMIVTQTLLFIYDLDAAVRTLYRCLKPGGVLLLTLPGISPIIRDDADTWGQHWSFTPLSTRTLLAEFFDAEQIEITSYGNAVSACAFLLGLAVEDVSGKDLSYHDADYPVIIGAAARKRGTP